ncbi:hypothetical protein GCM10018966_049830 [Streptomyces yanii]
MPEERACGARDGARSPARVWGAYAARMGAVKGAAYPVRKPSTQATGASDGGLLKRSENPNLI